MINRLLIGTVAVSMLVSLLAYAEDSPEAVYKKYTAAIESKNIDELMKYLSKQQSDMISAETPEDRQKMIDMIAEFMPKSISVVEQTIAPDGKSATLKLTGKGGMGSDEGVSGTVSLVKEESGWKIEREQWSN